MNFGLLKASIDVGNDRLEKAVAQALGHTVSGGVSTATHEVARQLMRGSLTNDPAAQSALKQKISIMGTDVSKLLSRAKVIYSGVSSGNNSGYVDTDITKLETDINTLVTSSIGKIDQSALDTAIQRSTTTAEQDYWIQMKKDVASYDTSLREAEALLNRVKASWGSLKGTNAADGAEILKLKAVVTQLNHEINTKNAELGRLRQGGNAALRKCEAALRQHQTNPSSQTSSNLGASTKELKDAQALIAEKASQITLLESRVEEVLKSVTDPAENAKLKTKFAGDDIELHMRESSKDPAGWWTGDVPVTPKMEAWWIAQQKAGFTLGPYEKVFLRKRTISGRGITGVTHATTSRYAVGIYDPNGKKAEADRQADIDAAIAEGAKVYGGITDKEAETNAIAKSASLLKGEPAPPSIVGWYLAKSGVTAEPGYDLYFLGNSFRGSWSSIKWWSYEVNRDDKKSRKEELDRESARRAAETARVATELATSQAALEAAKRAASAPAADAAAAATAQAAAAEAARQTALVEQRSREAAEAAETTRLDIEAEQRRDAQEKKNLAEALKRAEVAEKAAAEKAAADTQGSSGTAVTNPVAKEYVEWFKLPSGERVDPSRAQLAHTYGKDIYGGSKQDTLLTKKIKPANLPTSSNIAGFYNGYYTNGTIHVNVDGNKVSIPKSVNGVLNPIEVTFTDIDNIIQADNSIITWSSNDMAYCLLYIIHKQGLQDQDGKTIISANQELKGKADASFEASPFSSMFLWM